MSQEFGNKLFTFIRMSAKPAATYMKWLPWTKSRFKAIVTFRSLEEASNFIMLLKVQECFKIDKIPEVTYSIAFYAEPVGNVEESVFKQAVGRKNVFDK